MRILPVGILLLSTLSGHAQLKAIAPAGSVGSSTRAQSPAVDAGDYVYISGQGPRRPDGSLPSTFQEQVRQVLDNIKMIVQAAGLTARV